MALTKAKTISITPTSSCNWMPDTGTRAGRYFQIGAGTVMSEALAGSPGTLTIQNKGKRAKLSRFTKERVYNEAKGRCFFCNKLANPENYKFGPSKLAFNVEHKVPVCQGGTNEPDNLLCACQSCNDRKGKKSLEEYRQYLRFLPFPNIFAAIKAYRTALDLAATPFDEKVIDAITFLGSQVPQITFSGEGK